MNHYAPVLIFAYRRPEHLRNTITSLMRCAGFQESPVIVYADGPRGSGEYEAVMATREVARSMLGERAEYHFSEANRGLSESVISGVTETLERFGRVIVVEDDLDLSPTFLIFMNAALNRYADEENVYQVSGYMFDVQELAEERAALFLPFTVSWGWATWKRAWERFDPIATGWEALRADKQLRRRFNLDGGYDYSTMLIRQMAGLRDSWAIRWYWTVFKAKGLVLFPPVSLVRNTGFDGSGTHGRGLLRRFSAGRTASNALVIGLPEFVHVDARHHAGVIKAMRSHNGGWLAPVVDCLRRLLRH